MKQQLIGRRPRIWACAALVVLTSASVASSADSDSGHRAVATAASTQLIARTNAGLEVQPSANGRAAILAESNVIDRATVFRWRGRGLQVIASQKPALSVGLGINNAGNRAVYGCGSKTVCMWAEGHGVIRRIALPCGPLLTDPTGPLLESPAVAKFGRVSANLRTIVVECETTGPEETKVHAPLIIQSGRALPTRRLLGYSPLGVSDDGRTVVLTWAYADATYIYSAGQLHKLPGLGGISAFSHNARFFVARSANGSEYLIYDRTSGRLRHWTPPAAPVLLNESLYYPPAVTAISNSGQRLIYGDSSGMLYLVELASGSVTALATEVNRTFAPYLGLSADGRTLFYERHLHPEEYMVSRFG